MKEGYRLKVLFCCCWLAGVKTVADRDRLAKNCWRAFNGHQHWWSWTSL